LKCQIRVTEYDHGLAFLDHIAWFDKHSINASTIRGIDVDGLARYDIGTQRDEIMKNAALGGRQSHLFQRYPLRSYFDSPDKLHGKQYTRCDGGRRNSELCAKGPARWRPGFVMDLSIHSPFRLAGKL
jgi:hypothetical protein